MTDTADELRRRVTCWRQWAAARLISTHLSADDIAAMTDEQLRAVCETTDGEREIVISEILQENSLLPPEGQNH